MSDFKLDNLGRFDITDYQNKWPFANMMTGIAGPMGIPMWIFYVNRGQAITSFGVENKDHPIMEFQPANKAYQSTSLMGFRTFIKIIEGNHQAIFEPFSGVEKSKMTISLNELELVEENQGLRVEIIYFSLPEEPIAGLMRQVKITNLADKPANLEILDGMPAMIPYGVTNKALKETSRTLEAWIDISNRENNLPFFQLRSTLVDKEEVRPIRAGNFSYAFSCQQGQALQVVNLVCPEVIFGQDTSLRFPTQFAERPVRELPELSQNVGGKMPCAFYGFESTLLPSASVTLYSVYGFAPNIETLNKVAPKLNSETYFRQKRENAEKLVHEIAQPIFTKTGLPVFDAYSKQTFVDNVLRGGWPIYLGNPKKPKIYHIYSRKHGDPERDYNAFYLAPEYFSQGNGNYRDINQNRRSEVWFDPRVGDSNVRAFISLIQTDGYNPLVVKGSQFWIAAKKRKALLDLVVQPEQLEPFLNKPFTPGGMLKFLEQKEIALKILPVDFLQHALELADQYFDAEFGEGYWTDHWTYNLDLIYSFLSIYPDQVESMLFEHNDLPFFESPVFVQPRSKKYILAGNQPRQYNAVIHDKEKAAMIADRKAYPCLTRIQNGLGSVYKTSLFAKLAFLALIKFATMDPKGMGIEMEAGKPAWCDALNGLPGLFGSSMSETIELARLLEFLLEHQPKNDKLELPVEIIELLEIVVYNLQEYSSSQKTDRDFWCWDAISTARENYREKTRLGFEGKIAFVLAKDLLSYFQLFLDKVNDGINKAVLINEGIPPTYFTYEIEEFDFLLDSNGKVLTDNKQHPFISARRFRQNFLPLFLEAPVHMMRTLKSKSAAHQLHEQVKRSALYDRSLKMYKTNESLDDQSLQIGRLRVFAPGWLENESIFLHMEYKYLLELLIAEQYEDYFQDLRHALIAFQDPARYGRSPLENSSFIVSSAHPDKTLHGRGFVARLTGATAEFLNMWTLMMIGKEPFIICNNQLCLQLQPALPEWLFTKDGGLSFTLLGHCVVTYHNPQRKNTYDENMQIQTMQLYLNNELVEIKGNLIPAPYASLVREGRIHRIDAFFSS